jgi:nitrous-oxide reductase
MPSWECLAKVGAGWSAAAGGLLLAAGLAGCGPEGAEQALRPGGGNGSQGVAELMQARSLSEADVAAALKTYTPTGGRDPYLLFSSGGHSGQVLVIGVPSMRLLKVIGVFTPEPWQGYGYGDQTSALLASGDRNGTRLAWADTHHPALSETGGEYDGRFLFINDKANARVAVIDLHDFVTTQIVRSGLIESDHGAAFVTPDTEYVIQGTQYPAPLGGGYAPIEDFDRSYRGAAIFWKFDRERGRIVPGASWAVELPPYMQDLADAGKGASHGLAFLNSFDTERAWGGVLEGRPPLESGASQNDMDYLHVIDWRRGEALVSAGKARTVAGMRVIPLETAAAEGVLHFIGEPKSPHGVDVTPDGREVVVAGKLDTHATIYSVEKIRGLIERKEYAGKDPYGVPILPFEASIRAQVEIGLGPLHTQFDGRGNAYTSLFLESKVAKWSLAEGRVLEKIPVQYNVGHIAIPEGDTVSPDGGYLVSLNKWAIDRFNDVGPLLPQSFQLVDISGSPMQLLYDLPIPLGEPHYAQIIEAKKLKPVDVYTPVGTDAVARRVDDFAVEGGKERIERQADGVHVYMTAVRSHFTPDVVRVKQGDRVHLHITNVEQAKDATHGFALGSHNINLSLEPGEHSNVSFVAERAGVFPLYCTEFCSALHLEMAGYLLVEPR